MGVVLLAIPVVVTLAFGIPGFGAPATVVQLGALAVAGLLVLAAGLRESYAVGGRTVRWNVLYGLGTATLGVGLAAGLGVDRPAGGEGLLFAVAAVGGGLSLAFIGYDFARGGRHFRVPDRSGSE
jgi:hypothetical protein